MKRAPGGALESLRRPGIPEGRPAPEAAVFLILGSTRGIGGKGRVPPPFPGPSYRADQLSVSAQMFFAHASAYCFSSSLRCAETPPEPGTVSSAFFSGFQRCTESTCIASRSET
jgi:hypothetical protein